MHLFLHFLLKLSPVLPVLIDFTFHQTQKHLTKLHLKKSTRRNKHNSQNMPSSLDSFSEIFNQMWNRGGGRRPQFPNENALDKDEETWMRPCGDNQTRLTIVQITDVYT